MIQLDCQTRRIDDLVKFETNKIPELEKKSLKMQAYMINALFRVQKIVTDNQKDI